MPNELTLYISFTLPRRLTHTGLPSPYHESVILLEEVSGLAHHVSATSGDVTKLEFVDQSVFGRATNILNKMGKSGSGSAARMPKAEKTRFRMVRGREEERGREKEEEQEKEKEKERTRGVRCHGCTGSSR